MTFTVPHSNAMRATSSLCHPDKGIANNSEGGHMKSTNWLLMIAAALSLLLAFNTFANSPAKPCEAKDEQRIGGAYRLADGNVISILSASTPGQWRITHFGSGRSHKLYPTKALHFQSASDLGSETPVAFRYEFGVGTNGLVDSLTIKENGNRALSAKKIGVREEATVFKSGDVELFGKLTLPSSGKAPFKTVVYVHGSDPVPSVDQEWLPHLLAANGIATFVFDKRGAGCSKGQYVQHFGVLSDDVIAAVSWLKTKPEVDANRIGLAGFSQGGWVAPLAALKDPSIKFVLVGYGLAMSMADEDRFEAPLKLKEKGVDLTSIAEYQELNTVLHDVARANFKDWQPFDEKMAKFKDRAWLINAKEMQSWVGFVMQQGIVQAKVIAPPMFEHFFQPFYEPVPTLEKLSIPMLWLIAANDIEAPPEPTIEALKKLRQQGKPFSTVVFPNADHGMQEFDVHNGKRVRTKYADKYFSTMLKWIQAQ
jgi:uncharacterized protein